MTAGRSGVSRRRVLAGAAALAAGTFAAACGSGATSPSGDRLRVAFAAGGARENLDPHLLPQFVDQARARACFDTLAGWSQQMGAEPRLAESWESDTTGSRWRVRLRDNRFHDGRPLTSADVLYTLRRITTKATAGSAAAAFSGVDHAASRAISAREVEIVLGRRTSCSRSRSRPPAPRSCPPERPTSPAGSAAARSGSSRSARAGRRSTRPTRVAHAVGSAPPSAGSAGAPVSSRTSTTKATCALVEMLRARRVRRTAGPPRSMVSS